MLGPEGLKLPELRHTAGTLAAQTGATTKELMAGLRHSRRRAAMIYQHATSERDRRIAERLAEMLEAERGRAPCAVEIVPEIDAPDPWARVGHDGPPAAPRPAPGQQERPSAKGLSGWSEPVSIRRPRAFQARALPTELSDRGPDGI